MKSCALGAVVAIGLAAFAAPAIATITLGNNQSIGLDAVLADPQRQVMISDKLFTFLTYTSVQFPASQVFLVGRVEANPLNGVGFDLTGGFGDINPGDSTISEFNLRYTVEVQPAFIALGYRIVDAELSFNGAATGAGSYSRVDESFFNYNGVPGQNLLAQSSVYAFGSGSPPSVMQQHPQFGPPGYTKLEIDKDVQFFAFGSGNSATASFVRQTFSQVPTPGAIWLFGCAGLLAARRRR
jgi:hypothetical protein